MSLKLQGKIIRFPLLEYARNLNVDISDRAISPLKLLWLTLADFHNEQSGQCNPSIKTLAACIEKSESQTTAYMGILKKLGLVIAIRNAKGGRFTPQYTLPMPSHPVDKDAKHPMDNAPEISTEATPTTKTIKGSHSQDPTTPVHRTQILIEPLDESLIKSLFNEKSILKKNIGLVGYAKKYGYVLSHNTPIHAVEDWLLKQLNSSISHGNTHGNH